MSSWWPSWNYLIGYDTGFGGRKLIGTLVGALMPGTVDERNVRLLIIGANLLSAAGFVGFVSLAFRKVPSTALPLAALTAFYLVSPFSIVGWMSTGLSVCYMEVYMMVLMLGWLLVHVKWRRRWFYYPATLLVAVACCLIHHTFCCLYFPLMAGLMVHDCVGAKGIDWKKATAYGGICLALLGLFVAIWQWSTMTVDIDTLFARATSRAHFADNEWDRWVLEVLYYMSNADNRTYAFQNAPRIPQFCVESVLMLPFILLFLMPWLRAARSQASGWMRLRYRLAAASQLLLTMPIFFMATDYSRWWSAFCFCQFALLLAAVASGDKLLQEALQQMWRQGRRWWPVALLLAVYLSQLHICSFDGLREGVRAASFLRAVFSAGV